MYMYGCMKPNFEKGTILVTYAVQICIPTRFAVKKKSPIFEWYLVWTWYTVR